MQWPILEWLVVSVCVSVCIYGEGLWPMGHVFHLHFLHLLMLPEKSACPGPYSVMLRNIKTKFLHKYPVVLRNNPIDFFVNQLISDHCKKL